VNLDPAHDGQLDLFHQPAEPELVVVDVEAFGTGPATLPGAWQVCRECGHTGDDVMYGCCRSCFDASEAA
jgi:hypothetical protein